MSYSLLASRSKNHTDGNDDVDDDRTTTTTTEEEEKEKEEEKKKEEEEEEDNKPLFLTHKVKIRGIGSVLNVYNFQLEDHLRTVTDIYLSKCKCRHTHNKRVCPFVVNSYCRVCDVKHERYIDFRSLLFHHRDVNRYKLATCSCIHHHSPPCGLCLGCRIINVGFNNHDDDDNDRKKEGGEEKESSSSSCMVQRCFECVYTSDTVCYNQHDEYDDDDDDDNGSDCDENKKRLKQQQQTPRFTRPLDHYDLLGEHLYNIQDPLFYFCYVHRHTHVVPERFNLPSSLPPTLPSKKKTMKNKKKEKTSFTAAAAAADDDDDDDDDTDGKKRKRKKTVATLLSERFAETLTNAICYVQTNRCCDKAIHVTQFDSTFVHTMITVKGDGVRRKKINKKTSVVAVASSSSFSKKRYNKKHIYSGGGGGGGGDNEDDDGGEYHIQKKRKKSIVINKSNNNDDNDDDYDDDNDHDDDDDDVNKNNNIIEENEEEEEEEEKEIDHNEDNDGSDDDFNINNYDDDDDINDDVSKTAMGTTTTTTTPPITSIIENRRKKIKLQGAVRLPNLNVVNQTYAGRTSEEENFSRRKHHQQQQQQQQQIPPPPPPPPHLQLTEYTIFDPSLWREQSKNHYVSFLRATVTAPELVKDRYKRFNESKFSVSQIKKYKSGKLSVIRTNITGFETRGIYQTSTISCVIPYWCVLIPRALYELLKNDYDLTYVGVKRDPSIKPLCLYVCRAVVNPDPDIETTVIPDVIAPGMNQDQDGDKNGIYVLPRRVAGYERVRSFLHAVAKMELASAFRTKRTLDGSPRLSFSENNLLVMHRNSDELRRVSKFFKETYDAGTLQFMHTTTNLSSSSSSSSSLNSDPSVMLLNDINNRHLNSGNISGSNSSSSDDNKTAATKSRFKYMLEAGCGYLADEFDEFCQTLVDFNERSASLSLSTQQQQQQQQQHRQGLVTAYDLAIMTDVIPSIVRSGAKGHQESLELFINNIRNNRTLLEKKKDMIDQLNRYISSSQELSRTGRAYFSLHCAAHDLIVNGGLVFVNKILVADYREFGSAVTFSFKQASLDAFINDLVRDIR